MDRNPVSRPPHEPTLDEILSDPVVRAMMEADGVDPSEVEAMVRRIARTRREAAKSGRAMAQDLF
jgi:hypothetical protein